MTCSKFGLLKPNFLPSGIFNDIFTTRNMTINTLTEYLDNARPKLLAKMPTMRSRLSPVFILNGFHKITFHRILRHSLSLDFIPCREQELKLIPTPTPRWPDLVCAYNSSSRLLFTSKLFSAHVCPSAVNSDPKSAFDVKGWETYEQDWHYFYDCMLAPVARQASGNFDRPSLFFYLKLSMSHCTIICKEMRISRV